MKQFRVLFSKQFLPNLVLIICLVVSTIASFFSYRPPSSGWLLGLTYEQIGAILAVAINTYLFFQKRSAYKYSLILTLILGLFNLLVFLPFGNITSIRIGGLIIMFQTFPLIILSVAYFLNFNRVNHLLKKTFGSSDKQKENSKRKLIEQYKAKYESYENSDLQSISENSKYNEYIRKAAKEILGERERKQS
ncbi:hypothetical protein [Jiulongibacter sediminis]|uniref:hypothetical protein n=1 Tax=Jiulongibacter sediminis TaxID=1605367 RepID=UPI0026F2BDF0|nr:hypothetical protein [Jiulongibacter sediminis]